MKASQLFELLTAIYLARVLPKWVALVLATLACVAQVLLAMHNL